MRIARAVKGSRLARFDFEELCGSAMGAADYTAISEAFHTIFVEGLAVMSLVHINQVRTDETADDATWGIEWLPPSAEPPPGPAVAMLGERERVMG